VECYYSVYDNFTKLFSLKCDFVVFVSRIKFSVEITPMSHLDFTCECNSLEMALPLLTVKYFNALSSQNK
jgi:hypothetical protein